MDTELTRFEALKACLLIAGNMPKMAADLGVSQPTIWRWVRQSKQMPGEYVLAAERLYGVSCHDLRPDLYPRARFIGVDHAAPGYERAGYITVPEDRRFA